MHTLVEMGLKRLGIPPRENLIKFSKEKNLYSISRRVSPNKRNSRYGEINTLAPCAYSRIASTASAQKKKLYLCTSMSSYF